MESVVNIEQQNWFSTPLWDLDCEVSLGEIRSLVKKIHKKDPEGAKLTNIGGWQSKAYPNVCSKYENDYGIAKEMKPLIEFLNNVADACAKQIEIPNDLKLQNFWFNINKFKDHNTLHNHRGSLISGVLYLITPEDSGAISFQRTDLDLDYYLPEDLKKRNAFTGTSFTISPKQGKILMFPSWFKHSVEPNNSRNKRISMSFNYGVATQDDI